MLKHYTIEELRALPIKQLRNIDIDTPDYEQLVNQVVNEKLAIAPVPLPINRKDIPDIKNVQEEKEWQKVVNLREAQVRPVIVEEVPQVPEVVNSDPVQTPTSLPETTTPTVEVIPQVVAVDALKAPFCDSCASKGVRHLKSCPKFK